MKVVSETKSFFRLHVIKPCNIMPQDAPWAQKTHEELLAARAAGRGFGALVLLPRGSILATAGDKS